MEITQKELQENPNIELSEHQRFVAVSKWLNAIYNEQKKQTDKLGSINSTLNIFLVIVIVGIVISACNAILR